MTANQLPETEDRTADCDLGEAVEVYLDLLRSGAAPPVDEYAERYGDGAAELRRVLATLTLLENAKNSAKILEEPKAAVAGRFGDYQIVREIGRGGMGIVYEAIQQSLGRRVALKVLAPAALLDVKYVRRFEREARAAAQLHHTNIVPVFGVGVEQGRHYFVMQYIAGLGLDAVIAQLRAAAPDGRRLDTAALAKVDGDEAPASLASGRISGRPRDDTLVAATTSAVLRADRSSVVTSLLAGSPRHWQNIARIGREIAQALAYAHAHGTLHRDIKPSNLLIDAAGSAWLSDFGLAKALDEEDLTATGEMLGTLRYAPPEALRGQYDARGDVFALGLTLYELCALRPARDAVRRDHLVRQALQDAPSLGRVNPAIPRDLQTIVHKAVEIDPQRRYATADELAADLERFLDDQPIRARRLGAAERAWRRCRRNPAISLTAATAATLIITTVAVAFASVNASLVSEQRQRQVADEKAEEARQSMQMYLQALDREKQQRKTAEAKTEEARTSLGFARQTVDHYLRALGDSPELKAKGLDPLRRKLLNGAREFYDHLSDRFGDEPDLQSDRANGYVRLGQFLQDTGDYRGGLALMQQGEAILLELNARHPRNTKHTLRLAGAYEAQARVLQKLGRHEDSDAIQEKSVAIHEKLAAASPPDDRIRWRLAKSYELLGVSYSRVRGDGPAGDAYEKSLATYRGVRQTKENSFELQREIAETLCNLGQIRLRQKRLPEALAIMNEAVELLQPLHDASPEHVRAAGNLGIARGNLGMVLQTMGRAEEARDAYQAAINLFASLAQRRPEIVMYREYLGNNLNNLGWLHLRSARMKDAEAAFARLVDVRSRLAAEEKSGQSSAQLVRALQGHVIALVETANYGQAIELSHRWQAELMGLDSLDQKRHINPLELGYVYFHRGRALLKIGMLDDARLALHAAHSEARAVAAELPQHPQTPGLIARIEQLLQAAAPPIKAPEP